MEIGNSNIQIIQFSKDHSLNNDRINQCHAVFNLRENGLGILISDKDKKNILAAGHYQWPHILSAGDLLRELEKKFTELSLDFKNCLSLCWFLMFPKVSMIPHNLYKAEQKRNILTLTCRIGEDDLTEADIWPREQIVALYAYPEIIKLWLQQYFPESKVAHYVTSLNSLKHLYSRHSTFALLMVYDNYAGLFIAQNGNPVFYNQFYYNVEEDLLYYLLFTFEQNRLIAPEIDLKLGGKVVKGQKLQRLLEEYIGTVEEIEIPLSFLVSPQVSRKEIKKEINLLGGL